MASTVVQLTSVTKNVLHLLGSFHLGGSESQAVQLISLLHQERSFRVFVACLSKEGGLLPEIERLGYIDFPEFPLTSFYDRNALQQLMRCSRYIRENDIQIIQTHDFYTNVFGMLAGFLARVPARIAAKRETGMRTRGQRFVERRAFSMADRVVVNAEAVKDYLIGSGVPPAKITTIHNGLNLSKVDSKEVGRRAVLEKLDLPSAATMQFVTILANLRSPVKNH
ncbi:MAG: glycosyltransferase, partial [Acidobacteriota bacterium]